MEGLEIKEKKLYEVLSNKDFRIDSSFYTKEPKKNPDLIYAKIGEHLISSQYGISIEMNTDSVGYPIYRMNEIHDMLCDLDVDKCADITQAEYDRFALKDRDVLFNRTNSFEWVGRTGIYYQNDNIQRTFASYLVRLNPKDSILPEYLCAYLNCKYGEWDVKRRARQSINQTNVNPEEVKEIEIPILDIDLQQKIRNCFTQANSLRILSQKAYSDAELILNNELGTNAIAVANVNVSQKRFSDFVDNGRLDAEYYQPKYDEIIRTISQYPYGHDKIGNLYILRDKNFLPDNNTRYKYIELSDIGVNGEISGSTYEYGSNLPSRARRVVHTGDIIISSIEGSLQNGALCSTGFYVLSPRSINSETSLVLFKSSAIQALLKRACTGTILTAMNKDEFTAINLPVINKDIQNKIADVIRQSTILHSKSKHLLKITKTAVEIAIEQGEAAAIKLLDI
ncbi:restriction endonuclease subunit S [Alistipes ihumii]|uniref:restriction endonuclease subunit S n=1 Tax=Alistipes ihumii TaxID=1470347 RepID=UPI0026DABA8E|nr:restriction endonuclease subunit S [Alistipes ihumii]